MEKLLMRSGKVLPLTVNCTEVGVDVGISCTLSVESLERFESTIDILNNLNINGLGFNLAMTSPGYELPPDYAVKASEKMLEAYQIFRDKGVYEDRIMRKVNAFVESQVHPFDCGASGGGQIVIAPDGEIGVCHGYLGSRKFFSSHVRNSDFDPQEESTFLEWSRRSPLLMDQCQECFALGICGGGCPLQSDIEKGSIWELDDRFCVHSKRTLEWLIWDLYEKMSL